MATSSNFEDTLVRVAPAGGAVVGTIHQGADSVVGLVMTAATSGNDYTSRVAGCVRNVVKFSGTAWTAGQRLSFDGTAFTHVITGLVVVAHAAAPATSAAIVGDVILRLPAPISP